MGGQPQVIRNRERRAFRWWGSGMCFNSLVIAGLLAVTGDYSVWVPTIAVAIGAGFAVAGEAVARSAVRAGPQGIRIVNRFSARDVPWHDVREFVVAPSTVRAEAAWVVLRSGERVRLNGLESIRRHDDPTAPAPQIAELNELASATYEPSHRGPRDSRAGGP